MKTHKRVFFQVDGNDVGLLTGKIVFETPTYTRLDLGDWGCHTFFSVDVKDVDIEPVYWIYRNGIKDEWFSDKKDAIVNCKAKSEIYPAYVWTFKLGWL